MQGDAGDSVGICHHPGPLRGPEQIQQCTRADLVIWGSCPFSILGLVSNSALASEKAMGHTRLLGKLPTKPSVPFSFFLPKHLSQEVLLPFCRQRHPPVPGGTKDGPDGIMEPQSQQAVIRSCSPASW